MNRFSDSSSSVFEIVRHARLPLCITDPNLPDNPIVFVNSAFAELTGYSESEVLGKNCRFLQGPETTPESVAALRDIIRNQAVGTGEIINYRKDGSKFVNALQIGPTFDADGNLEFFFGSQLDVTETRELEARARELASDEVFHRLRNVVNVMSIIVRMTAKQEDNVHIFGRKITERLKALSELHFSSRSGSSDQFLMGELVERIVSVYAPRGDAQIIAVGGQIEVEATLGTVLSLVLHELAANAVKHGALGSDSGFVEISWNDGVGDDEAFLSLEWREFGAASQPKFRKAGGTAIMKQMVGAVEGQLEFDSGATGIIARLKVPFRSWP
jgi:PAS domain S-box-containing protein